jgi:hypothetical protein
VNVNWGIIKNQGIIWICFYKSNQPTNKPINYEIIFKKLFKKVRFWYDIDGLVGMAIVGGAVAIIGGIVGLLLSGGSKRK